MLVEDGEDLCEEAVRASTSVAVYVQNDNGVLHRDRRGLAALVEVGEIGAGAAARELRFNGVVDRWLGYDDSPG